MPPIDLTPDQYLTRKQGRTPQPKRRAVERISSGFGTDSPSGPARQPRRAAPAVTPDQALVRINTPAPRPQPSRRQRTVQQLQAITSSLAPEQAAIVPDIIKAARKYNVPASLLAGLTEVESGFNPEAVSPADAFGLTQFIPETAQSYGVQPGSSPKAVRSQIEGAARYLQDLGIDADPRNALASYNAGPGNPGAAGDYPEKVLAAANDYSALDRFSKAKLKGTQFEPARARKIPSAVKLGKIAEDQFGLTVGENPAFGGVDPVHVEGSYHYQEDQRGRGEAIDVSGDPEALLAFNKFVADNYGSAVTELFYDPGVNIDNGQPVKPIGGHSDHVHLAVAQPGSQGVAVSGPVAALVGYTPPKTGRRSTAREKALRDLANGLQGGLSSLSAGVESQAPVAGGQDVRDLVDERLRGAELLP